MRRLAPALLALLLAAPAAQACRVERRAELAVTVAEGFPLVRAEIGGRAVSLLVDTGAQDMLLTPEAALRLGLARDPARRTLVMGTGGDVVANNALVPRTALGGVALEPRSVPVAPVPGLPGADPPVAGLLGASLLSRYDLELDMQAGRMALHEVRDCPGGVQPFPPPFVAVPLALSAAGEPFVTVLVNGVALEALVDTGSRGTVLTEAAAARAGLGAMRRSGDTRGVDGAAIPLRQHEAQELRVGWDVLRKVRVNVAPLRLARGDMLLGADYFATRRVWMSYSSRRMFVQMPGR